jgi:hypothetical protein
MTLVSTPKTPEDVEAYLRGHAPQSVLEEIRYLVEDVEHEDEYTFLDGWRDVADRFDERDAGGEFLYPMRFRRNVQRLLVGLGEYRAITRVEMDQTYVSRGKKYDFKLDGRFYVWDHHVPQREDKDEEA